MELDIDQILAQYPIKQLEEKISNLQSTLNNAHKDPTIDMGKLSAELSEASTKHALYAKLHGHVDNYTQAKEMLDSVEDAELQEMASIEIESATEAIQSILSEIEQLLIAEKLSDPDDLKSVILEIRAGAGGEEAALFASDLYGMYQSFSNSKGWTISVMSSNISENGGFKELIAKIDGKNAYKSLKYESGVHRVQRIPVTESGGRIHTSTASVAILPEAEDIDVEINKEDLRIDTMRSSGAGGQSVNKTDSAIRITHIPTGIVVSCQDTKVQQQNKERAMQILRSRLYELKKEEEAQKRSDMRSGQIGSAKRSEKIRTYNYPQSRVTDHRVKISWHNLEEIIGGSIEVMLNEVHEAMLAIALEEIRKADQKKTDNSSDG